jgi:hypothetical protein
VTTPSDHLLLPFVIEGGYSYAYYLHPFNSTTSNIQKHKENKLAAQSLNHGRLQSPKSEEEFNIINIYKSCCLPAAKARGVLCDTNAGYRPRGSGGGI